MKAVSLFSGCLGLDLGLEAAGVEPVCFVESDDDCAALIRQRRPGVRIVRDVRDVDASLLAEVGSVELVAGGFPCQDLSYAGRGAGLDGDRSGLWFEMARVVRELRPRVVLVENVPGLLTRGLGVVVHELALAGYVGRWFTLGAVDVGAPHRRERVFVIARRADASRVEPLLGGHASGLLRDDGWFSPQESLFDSSPLLRLGKRGRWTLDAVYEDDPRLAIDDDSDETLLPTPNAYESTPTGEFVDEMREAGVDPEARLYLPGRKHHVQRTLSRVAPMIDEVGQDGAEGEALLPTPGAWLGRRPENSMADPERAASRKHEGTRGKRSIELPDALAAEVTVGPLLPTPVVSDGRGNTDGSSREGGGSLREIRDRLLPTPAARDGKGANPNEREGGPDLPAAIDDLPAAGTTLTDAVWEAQGRETDTGGKLLPTPSAALADGGQKTRGGDRQDELLLGGIAEAAAAGRLLPTPVANPENPGSGGELRAALEHGPGRRNETGIDSLGRPNAGRPSRKLLPTPQKSDGDGGRLDRNPETVATGKRPSGSKASVPLATAIDLMPTPTAADGDRTSDQFSRHYTEGADNPTLLGAARRIEWGVYEPAVRRWESVLGREAPAPTDEKGRLAPAFVEWMMGFDDGWTDVGISRTARLRLLGNAVHVLVGARVALAAVALDRQLSPESSPACA